MPQPARPADFAIVCNRMLIELLQMVWHRRYKKQYPDSMGRALELMLVSMWVSVATRDDIPPTATEVAKELYIRPSTAADHLNRLLETGRISKIKCRYHADLNYLDSLMRSAAYLDRVIAVIESCLVRLKALRRELRHQLGK